MYRTWNIVFCEVLLHLLVGKLNRCSQSWAVRSDLKPCHSVLWSPPETMVFMASYLLISCLPRAISFFVRFWLYVAAVDKTLDKTFKNINVIWTWTRCDATTAVWCRKKMDICVWKLGGKVMPPPPQLLLFECLTLDCNQRKSNYHF